MRTVLGLANVFWLHHQHLCRVVKKLLGGGLCPPGGHAAAKPLEILPLERDHRNRASTLRHPTF